MRTLTGFAFLVPALLLSISQTARCGSLLAHFNFDDSANPGRDSSGRDFHATGIQALGYTPAGAAGGAAVFNSAQRSHLAWTGALNPVANVLVDDFSISLFLKSTQVFATDTSHGYSGAGIVYADIPGIDRFDGIPMALTGNKLGFFTGRPADSTLHSTSDINTGQMVHVAVTWQRLNGVKSIYVNGVLEAQEAHSIDTDLSGRNELVIGGNTSDGRYFNGTIDDVQLYKRVLSDSEIAYLATHPGQIIEEPPPVSVDQVYADTDDANVWNGATDNWDDSTATWGNGNNAIFGGTGETVPVDSEIYFNSMTFNTGGYTLAAGAGVLKMVNPVGMITLAGAGQETLIAENIAGTLSRLEKRGPGTLHLTGTNTYTDGTAIAAGTLVAGSAASGGTGSLGAGPVSVAAGTEFRLHGQAGAYVDLPNSISGAGLVDLRTTAGADMLTLGGSLANFTGNLQVSGNARVRINQAAAAPPATANVNVLQNATLWLDGSPNLPAPVTLNGGNTGESFGQLRVDNGAVYSGTITLAGNITGAGDSIFGCEAGTGFITGDIQESGGSRGLSKGGGQLLVLSGTNSCTGPTAVNTGTLQFAKRVSLYNGDSTKWTAANISVEQAATLAINVGGPGEFTVEDIGTFLGMTGTGGLKTNSNLGIDTTNFPGGNLSYGLIPEGNGGTNIRGIKKLGTGTLTYTAANTYSSYTFVLGGTLVVPAGAAVNTLAIPNRSRIYVGQNSGSRGVLRVTGGTVNATFGNAGSAIGSLLVGDNAGAAGSVELESGAINLTRELWLGGNNNDNGAHANLAVSGGILTTGSYLVVGFNNDRATFDQTGGATVVSTNVMTIAAGNTGAVGVATLRGGNFTSNNGGIFVGERGNGTLNVGAANLFLSGNGLLFGNISGQNGWTGIVNLAGGRVTTNRIARGTGTGTSILNLNGGTIAATSANALFFTGLDSTYVHAGGGTVDNSGNAITIGQTLRFPPGAGISATGLSVTGGSGYISPPVVTVTGGGGTGATAIASVSNGAVTGISITNPGTGYSSAPTFTLAGGGGNGAAVTGAAQRVANTSGGMSFTGAATTRLTGGNTYTGDTRILAGNLQVIGGISPGSTTRIQAGATLSGTGNVAGPVIAEASTSVIAPGAGTIGTLATGPVQNAGRLSIEYGGPSADLLNVTGDLVMQPGATLALSQLSAPTAVAYLITSYTGNFSGTFAVTGQPSGYALVHDTVNHRIILARGFAAFMEGFAGLTEAQKLPAADPDADGIPNLLEYALDGLNPITSDARPGTHSAGLLKFNKRALAVSNADVLYSIEESATMGAAPSPWTPVPATEDTAGIFYQLPAGPARNFLRLKVSTVN